LLWWRWKGSRYTGNGSLAAVNKGYHDNHKDHNIRGNIIASVPSSQNWGDGYIKIRD
jgi:hypothetical protein